jgi:hypothetical protein
MAKKKQQGEKDVFKKKDFVSSYLPPTATEVLVEAAKAAAKLPEDSFERKKLIEDAIARARELSPERFRRENRDGGR